MESQDLQQVAIHEATSFLEPARALVVQTADDCIRATALRDDITSRRKAVENWFSEPVATLHKSWKALTERRRQVLERFDEPLRLVNAKLTAYEQARREAEQRAAQEAERRRQALIEEERLRRAVEAEQRGNTAQADAILEGRAPEAIIVVAPEATDAKPKGLAFTPSRRVKVVDLLALVKAVAEGREPLSYLEPAQTTLDAVARRLGDHFSAPGCELVTDITVRRTR